MNKKVPVSSFGFKVLQKLNSGRGGKLFPDGRCQVGSLIIPGSLIKNFLEKDLILVSGEQNVLLNEPGRMLLRRLLHLQTGIKNHPCQNSVDPYIAQHSNFRI